MKLQPCPFCGSDDVGIDQSFVDCYECAAMGPSGDPDGKMWDSAPRNIHATIESIESGPMPWRLQIAAMLLAHRPEDFTRKEAFVTADILICEHNESAPKEVQP